MNRQNIDPIVALEEPARDEGFAEALQGLLAACSARGFERGFERGSQYLSSALPRLIRDFERDYVGVSGHDRQVLTLFGEFVEEKLGSESDQEEAATVD